MERHLYILQRVTAAIMAPFVMIHLAVIFYALGGGLTAAEILGRTRGEPGWAIFYGLFVLALAIHAPIGLRAVIREWTPWRGPRLGIALLAFALLLLVLGLRAVAAVVLP